MLGIQRNNSFNSYVCHTPIRKHQISPRKELFKRISRTECFVTAKNVSTFRWHLSKGDTGGGGGTFKKKSPCLWTVNPWCWRWPYLRCSCPTGSTRRCPTGCLRWCPARGPGGIARHHHRARSSTSTSQVKIDVNLYMLMDIGSRSCWISKKKKGMACKWSCWITMSDGRSWGSESWGAPQIHFWITAGKGKKWDFRTREILWCFFSTKSRCSTHSFPLWCTRCTHSNLWCILWYNYHIATCRFHHSTVVHMFLSFSMFIRLPTLRPLWIGGFAQPTKPPKSSSSEA